MIHDNHQQLKTATLQLSDSGQLRHFLTIEHMPKALLMDILAYSQKFLSIDLQSVKTVPLLRGKTIMTLFFEASTRTRTTFELAAKRLSANVINLNISHSATSKGESLLDTLRNLEAMCVDMFIVRHPQSGAPHFIANQLPNISVVNAGDGRHAHPTQAMLDMFTIQQEKGKIEGLKVAIVGDILHSRVARSQIHALQILGASEIRLVGPDTLMPRGTGGFNVIKFNRLKEGITNVDVIILLRLQTERMSCALLPNSDEYYHEYGLTPEKLSLAKPDAIVMHPGPINRGIEIASSVADGPQSTILKQVRYGLAVRMAILSMTLGSNPLGAYL